MSTLNEVVGEVVATVTRAAQHGGGWAWGTLAASTFVSEDLACVAAGLLVAQGAMDYAPATAACFTGIFVGDLVLVALGRTVGRKSLAAAPLRWWVKPEAVARAEQWFARRGARLILSSRFMPGTRLPTYVAAGVLDVPIHRFIGWFVLSCLLWTPLLVGGAMVFGAVVGDWLQDWAGAVPAALAVGLGAWGLIRLGTGLSTWRGRRRLLGRWRRLTRWEYWPRWAVYPPVVGYIVWLGLRHRCLTLFTAVNPGIGAGGGLVGESKAEILGGLAGAGAAVARWTLVPPGVVATRAAAVEAFMQREALDWPVVLKPDVGERGDGVVIARSLDEVTAAVAAQPGGLIAQAYVPGVEFGVFYYRIPDAERGEILAVTEKRLTTVRGDGRRTLEELILADDRAVGMAEFFLTKWADRLPEIPAAGETVALGELGTHCRGAIFFDGGHLVTPALAAAVERVSRTFAGYHFGRYDLRTVSAEALRRGEFTVIELNGLTSEATSIYDPKNSVWVGWKTLMQQWRIAFNIAAINRHRGAQILSLREVIQLVWDRTRTR